MPGRRPSASPDRLPGGGDHGARPDRRARAEPPRPPRLHRGTPARGGGEGGEAGGAPRRARGRPQSRSPRSRWGCFASLPSPEAPLSESLRPARCLSCSLTWCWSLSVRRWLRLSSRGEAGGPASQNCTARGLETRITERNHLHLQHPGGGGGGKRLLKTRNRQKVAGMLKKVSS